MVAGPLDREAIFGQTGLLRLLAPVAPVDRVRCVLRYRQRYLLVQPNTNRPESIGKWALPGGRLKRQEKPRAGLRRELVEELGLEVPQLLKLGDWQHRNENHRIFGCEIGHAVTWFDTGEIAAIGWFTYAEVTELAVASRLHRGFEFAAIRTLRIRRSI